MPRRGNISGEKSPRRKNFRCTRLVSSQVLKGQATIEVAAAYEHEPSPVAAIPESTFPLQRYQPGQTKAGAL